MAEYPDLSPYTYTEDGGGAPDVRNVGWLGPDGGVPAGDVPPAVVDELTFLATRAVNVMRGFHYCDFCDAESPIRLRPARDPARRAILGTGEIHVVSEAGVVYAAPTLIVHYITEHGYRPPDEFVEAVLAGRAA